MPNAQRVAGWGTLGFSLAFFVTFVVNALMNMGATGPDYPTASEMAADFGGGALFMLLWGSAGVAIVVAAVGLSAAVWPADAIASRVATSFGVIAGAGWIMAGVSGFAQRTALLNGNIAGAGADPAAERAVVEGLYIGVHTGGILFAFAALPWLALVAIGATKRHAMSRVAIGCLWVASVASLAGFLISGLQFGLLVVLLAFAVLGTSLLRRARKASRMTGAAASASAEVSAPAA